MHFYVAVVTIDPPLEMLHKQHFINTFVYTVFIKFKFKLFWDNSYSLLQFNLENIFNNLMCLERNCLCTSLLFLDAYNLQFLQSHSKL